MAATIEGIKCGSCKGRHETVALVRECYAEKYDHEAEAKAEAEAERAAERFWEEGPHGPQPEDPRERELQMMDDMRRAESEERWEKDVLAAQEAAEAARVLNEMTGQAGRDMASGRQVDYAMDLLAEREWPDTLVRKDVENMERRQVSKLINGLLAAPYKPMAGEGVEIPDGRYAVESKEDGILRFYQVEAGTGKWDGRLWVKQLFGSPGAFRKEHVTGRKKGRVLNDIAEVGPEEASKRFGLELGICGVCGSPLTNEESRALGIGPVCRQKRGW